MLIDKAEDVSAGADLRDTRDEVHAHAHANAHAHALAATSSPAGFSDDHFSMIGFEPAFARPVPPLLQVCHSTCYTHGMLYTTRIVYSWLQVLYPVRYITCRCYTNL